MPGCRWSVAGGRAQVPICGWVLLLGLLGGSMTEVIASAATIDDARPLVGTTWYTVSLMGQRAGYSCSTIEVDEPAEGAATLTVTDRMQAELRLAEGAAPLKVVQEVATVFDETLKPLRTMAISDQFGRKREVEATVREGGLDVVVRAGGTETRKRLEVGPLFGSDLLLPVDVASGRAVPGESYEVEVFNPELVALDLMSLTVDEATVLDDGRPGFRARVKSGLLPIETGLLLAADGELIRATTEGMLNLIVERADEKEALEAAAPLVLSSRIATNRQIADPKRLVQLTARISAGTQPAAELVPNTPRQAVTAGDNQALLTVQRLPFEGPTTAIPVTDEALAEYLAPSELSQCDDPAIVAKAKAIVGQETDARVAAALIVQWVYDRMGKVSSEPRLISAKEILEQMTGDCTEHAVLCGALCQAVGIPARMIAGIAYAHGGFYYHAWNLLYVGEWVEMDPAWGEMAPDAGHIRLADAALAPHAVAVLGLATGRCLGTLQVEILDAQMTPETSVEPEE